MVSHESGIVPTQRLFTGRFHPVLVPLKECGVSEKDVHRVSFYGCLQEGVYVLSFKFKDCKEEIALYDMKMR